MSYENLWHINLKTRLTNILEDLKQVTKAEKTIQVFKHHHFIYYNANFHLMKAF